MTVSITPEALFSPRADEPLLHLPLAELVSQTEELLERCDLFRRAARSSLYGQRWRAAGIKPELLQGRAALRRLPFLDGTDLIAMAESRDSLRKALLTRPRIWVTSRGTSGPKKWLPLTLADTAHWFARLRRVSEMLSVEPDAPIPTFVLAINEPMPRVSNALPYLWERADYLTGGQRLEFIVAAMTMLPHNHWDRFVVQKQPQWLMASVDDARRLAQELEVKASRALPGLRRGIFWSQPLDGPAGARAELESTYGLAESFSLYLSAECREMYAECPAHAGLHLWMDGVIHEIIPDGQAPAGHEPPETLFVDQAPPGTEGEYVITTFTEALPLIRYRTGDRIRVLDTAPCACGVTHPRVLFTGRMAASAA
ncbi:MAG: hypothetical protein QHJ81_04985 [Anaerolineae bacterium]|nr:hypothetical protein [Anaerolineae bacterium]